MPTMTQEATSVAREFTEPVMASVAEHMRDVRRAVTAGRQAADDYAAEAKHQVRRHPFISLGVAAGAGALLGCVIGFTAARCAGRRP